MHYRSPYRLFIACFLLLFFVGPLLVREVHLMVSHDHAVEASCDSPDGSDHLHDSEYHHPSCALCHLNFSEYLDLPHTNNRLAACLPVRIPIHWVGAVFYDSRPLTVCQRGPPPSIAFS